VLHRVSVLTQRLKGYMCAKRCKSAVPHTECESDPEWRPRFTRRKSTHNCADNAVAEILLELARQCDDRVNLAERCHGRISDALLYAVDGCTGEYAGVKAVC
jgi:hypothetical protein